MIRLTFLLAGIFWFIPLGLVARTQTSVQASQTSPQQSILNNELFAYALNSSASSGGLLDDTVRDLLDEELEGVRELPAEATYSFQPARDFGLEMVLACPDSTCYLTATNYGDGRENVPYATTLFYTLPRSSRFDADNLELIGAALANPDPTWQSQEFLLSRFPEQTAAWPVGTLRYHYLTEAEQTALEIQVDPLASGTVVPIENYLVDQSASPRRLRVEFGGL